MDDTRINERKRAMLGAQIIFNNRNSTLDCQVRNISPKGARLAISDTVTLPEEFDLHVPQKGKTYRARLRWRNNEGAGVEILNEEGPASPVQVSRGDYAMRIAELETENSSLRLKVVDLMRRLEEKEKPQGGERAA